jgi:hypothetical protein
MTEDSKMSKFDDRPYDVIVVDEALFVGMKMLAKNSKVCRT